MLALHLWVGEEQKHVFYERNEKETSLMFRSVCDLHNNTKLCGLAIDGVSVSLEMSFKEQD